MSGVAQKESRLYPICYNFPHPSSLCAATPHPSTVAKRRITHQPLVQSISADADTAHAPLLPFAAPTAPAAGHGLLLLLAKYQDMSSLTERPELCWLRPELDAALLPLLELRRSTCKH